MADSGTVLDGAPPAYRDWTEENDRGLALAADGEWAAAAAAFDSAAGALVQSAPAQPAPREPLALVLGNLAHACFRAGRITEAIQHAQRTCALRAAIAGEDGMPVARARMDLAVMLASSGRAEEALPLALRAIAAVEQHVGESDVRLAVLLENAARIALTIGSPSNAEPLLLRLRVLLTVHGLPTGRADRWLASVADQRDRARRAPRRRTPTLGTPTPPATVAAPPRVGETIERRRLMLDDLEPFDEPPSAPVTMPHDDPPPPSDAPTEGTSDAAADAPFTASFEPALLLPRAEEPPMPTPDEAAVAVPAAATPTAVPSAFHDLDRAPALALPTPDRGVRTIGTPSRGPRVVMREDARSPTPAARSVVADEGRRRGVYLPMILGTVAALAAGAGAVWWLILR